MNKIKGITDIDEGTLRRIDWQELCPPVLFLRVFPLSLRFFQLCFVAFVLTFLGYVVLTTLGIDIPNIETFSARYCGFSGQECHDVSELPFAPLLFFLPFFQAEVLLWSYGSLMNVAMAFPGAFLALAIARGFAVRLASTQQCSIWTALGYATRRFSSLILAVLIPVLMISGLTWLWKGTCFLADECEFCNLLERVFIPLAYLIVFVMVLVKVLLYCGFPLMLAAVAVDQSDGFDALSRSVSYLTQRPLHFICYVILAIVPGIIGYLLVTVLVNMVSMVMIEYKATFDQPGLWLQFWDSFCLMIPFAFIYIYTIGAAVAIYFMLRRSLDGTPYDVFKSALSNKPSRKLQPIVKDPQGAPIMADEVGSEAISNDSNNADNTAAKEV